MSERTEKIIVVIVACVIILLTAFEAFSQDKITELFTRYNAKQAEEFSEIVYEAAEKYHVDPNIIAAIIVKESGVRPTAISKGGDYGLMQVRWKMHRDKAKRPADLLNPRTNIFVGTRIFAEYYAQSKTIRGALVRYSGGSKTYANKIFAVVRALKNENN